MRPLRGAQPLVAVDDVQDNQRRQVWGVVVDTATRPERSSIGREYWVQSL
jgi:hypothetical protein